MSGGHRRRRGRSSGERRAPGATAAAHAEGRACGIYLITPSRIADLPAFAARLAGALAAAPVAAVQLRLKDVSDAEIAAAARLLMPIARAAGAVFIMNDRPDLAAELACDGVHIGQTDAPYAAARALVGPERAVGVTCHASRHLAMLAAEAGADYVAFGAFYPTATKDALHRADPEILSLWRESAVTPAVAIGGVTAANCAPLVAAGADLLAVSSAVWDDPAGPAAAVRALAAAIAETLVHAPPQSP